MMNGDGTVYIVDDDEAVRDAVELLISSVGLDARSFASGSEFLETGLPAGPACVLLDVRMPGMSGPEVQEHLQAARPDIPVIFLTGHGDVPVAVRALKRGAFDFLEKPIFDRQALLDRIQQGLRTHAERLDHDHRKRETQARIDALSRREREVMELVAGGLANKQIADRLGISERTVEIHRGRVMKKLGVRSAAELVRFCSAVAPGKS